MEIDGPIIKISSIFINDESDLYFADKISKLIPSPFKVSVRPFKSASDNIFAKAGASFNLKLLIVKLLEEISLPKVDVKFKLPPQDLEKI